MDHFSYCLVHLVQIAISFFNIERINYNYTIKGPLASVIRTASDGSQSGVGVFENGNGCDEWLFFRGECSNSPAALTPGTEKAIQTFLANKYKKPLSEVKIIIQKEAPGFAAGSVSFGQDGQGGGGMWLAVAGNQWDVVWDGNGGVDCNEMRQQYGFPDIILKPNFCD